MKFAYHGEPLDCPDCDEAGLNANDEYCTHLRERVRIDNLIAEENYSRPRHGKRWTDPFGDGHNPEHNR